VTLTEAFAAAVKKHAGQVAVVSLEDGRRREYTYEQLHQGAVHLARWLRQQGVGPGGHVGLALENRPEWIMAYFGILLAGAVAVPLDVQASREILAHSLGQTRAVALFASPRLPFDALTGLEHLQQIIVVGGAPPGPGLLDFTDVMSAPVPEVPLPDAAPGDLASIIYTSGTTGLPKGVMLTHANFMANYRSIEALGAVTPADNFLSVLPLYHAFPFMATLILPLFLGARITYIDTLKAEPILRCLKDEDVTILAVTPQVLQHFLRGLHSRLAHLPLGVGRLLELFLDLSWRVAQRRGYNPARFLQQRLRHALGHRFRYFISGGAKLPDDVALGFAKLGFTIMEGYGLTETAPVVSFNPLDAPKMGSVGKPLQGIRVAIDRPEARGVGEILIAGDNVMAGYYLNEAATREVIADGWFRSGDLGCLDEEGYLFIQGRLKDIIVLASGKNVSVEEVNSHYLQAPAIKEFYVLPNARNEKLVAVVVPDFDYFRQAGETDVQARVKWYLEFYSQQLESYKRVKDFVLTNQELPKTRLGKVKRYEVERIYQARSGQAARPKTSALEENLSPVGVAVVELLLDHTGLPVIALDDHLELDLGLDSLALVELVAALEQHFGVAIREEAAAGVFTVGELIRLMETLSPGPAAARPRQSWAEILATPPPDPVFKRIGLTAGFPSRMFTMGLCLLFDTLFGLGFRLRVAGREHLPEGGGLICSNHASFMDGFLIFSAVPWPLRPRLFFLGTTFYFELPLIRDLGRLLRVIPVDSARHLVAAMQAAAYVLRRDKFLCVFPEGARTVTGDLKEIKPGVAILARELGVRLIPAYIHGSHAAWPPGQPFPRPHPITIAFGPSRPWQELADRGRALKPDAKDYEAVTLGLRQEILSLAQVQATFP